MPIVLRSRSSSPLRGPPPPGPLPGESSSVTIDRLSAELKVARMGKIAAERRLRELDDVNRQREMMVEVWEKQSEAAWESVEEMKRQVAEKEKVIARLKADAEHFPLSTPALMKAYNQLSATFDTLRECLTCPLCYDGLAKGEAVSLQCGHTFCAPCIHAWSSSRRPAGLSDPPGKTIANVECPECRLGTAHPSAKRVKIYMLEEMVRLVARAEKERQNVEVDEKERRRIVETGEGDGIVAGAGEAEKSVDADIQDHEKASVMLDDRPRMPYNGAAQLPPADIHECGDSTMNESTTAGPPGQG